MRSPSPPRQLWDLDRSSRDFPNHLAHILLTEDCVSQAQDPQCANWEKLVEDLDYVCVQSALFRLMLISI